MARSALAPVSVSERSIASQVVMSAIPSVTLGETVTISGMSTESEVIVKVIHPTGGILYFNIVKVVNGVFTDSIVVGSSEPAGIYKVVAGLAGIVDTKDLIVAAVTQQ